MIEFAAKVGRGVRDANDDRLLVSGSILNDESCDGELELPTVVAVCDGCGGYAGGDFAAQMVLEGIAEEDIDDILRAEYLLQVLKKCQDRVVEKKSELSQYSKMCTTVAGGVFGEDEIILFHAGDSRIYRHDGWGIAKMTKDHSIVQEMVDMGDISPEEALSHPKRNVISRCIGIDCPLPEIYILHTTINPGEKYLFCSDGLWEYVDDLDIKEVLNRDIPLVNMVDILFDRALEQGADDNISICICYRYGEINIVEDNKPFILD